MELNLGSGAGGQDAAGDLIKDGSTATFEADVIRESQQVPVIVDFWAPWCGPCKQLTPALEAAVKAARGKVKLVKVNVDENQQLAQMLRIQSLPTVYAFHQGQPVDGFTSALPESQIKQFISRLTERAGGGGGDDQIAQALEAADQALANGDPQTAGSVYAQILQHESDNAAALSGLIRCQVAIGQLAEARELIDSLSDELQKDQRIAQARTALELAETAGGEGESAELRAKVDADPDDHQARYDLAMALYAEGDRDGAVDALLEIIRRDRTWNEEAARKQLVKLFEAFGPTDPLTVSGRRRLSSILFA